MEVNNLPQHIKSGAILLCRCKQQPFFVGRILVVDRVRQRCYARFEDNVKHWCNFSDIQNLGSSSNRCSLCNKVSNTADLVSCSACRLGFHRRCHNPVVPNSSADNWHCRVCMFNETACPNNVLSQGMPRRSNKTRQLNITPTNNEVSRSLTIRRKKNGASERTVDQPSKQPSSVSHVNSVDTLDSIGRLSASQLNDRSVLPTANSVTIAHPRIENRPKSSCLSVKLCSLKASRKDLIRRVNHAHWMQSRVKRKYKPRRSYLTSPSNTVPLTSLKLPQNVIDVAVIDAAIATDEVNKSAGECLRNSINLHFGAVGRLKAGARCRIAARRYTADRVEYLVQWDNGVIT